MKECSIGIQMPREVHISHRYHDSLPIFIPVRHIVLKKISSYTSFLLMNIYFKHNHEIAYSSKFTSAKSLLAQWHFLALLIGESSSSNPGAMVPSTYYNKNRCSKLTSAIFVIENISS